jgi:hypothetical protein
MAKLQPGARRKPELINSKSGYLRVVRVLRRFLASGRDTSTRLDSLVLLVELLAPGFDPEFDAG